MVDNKDRAMYWRLGHVGGKAWAQAHQMATPDDLAEHIQQELNKMMTVPREAKESFKQGFWKGASEILQ